MSNPSLQQRYPLWLIILAAATVAGVGMGIRQAMGLYQKPMTMEIGVGREIFSLSVAISNIVWGVCAPFFGAISDKYGTGRVVMFGGICTVIGLYLMYVAQSELVLLLAGLFLGFGVAGAGINALVGAVSRVAAPEQRTAAIARLGMGSGIGVLLAIPYTHLLIGSFGWQTSLVLLASTALIILPLAIPIAGRPVVNPLLAKQSLGAALREAFSYPSFWLLNAGFFVCGFHVVFYGTHLPAFVSDKGLDASVGVTALMMVGIGNLLGTYLAGEWGRRRSKRLGLAVIYLGRAAIFLGFLFLPITPFMVIAMSLLLGVFWLSTIPLTSGLVATFFGPTWMTMLYGIVFFSHQVGSFLGVWLGGRVFDLTRSYDMMWWISVGLGVFAALIHWPIREAEVPRVAAAATTPAPAE